jgi:hypothetical protein
MDDADLLRNRASRLFALATRSRQEGYSEYAEELDSLAREVVRHAVAIEGLPGSSGLESKARGLQVVASA